MRERVIGIVITICGALTVGFGFAWLLAADDAQISKCEKAFAVDLRQAASKSGHRTLPLACGGLGTGDIAEAWRGAADAIYGRNFVGL